MQDIAKQVAIGLVIITLLERLQLTRPVSWLEARAWRLTAFVPAADPALASLRA